MRNFKKPENLFQEYFSKNTFSRMIMSGGSGDGLLDIFISVDSENLNSSYLTKESYNVTYTPEVTKEELEINFHTGRFAHFYDFCGKFRCWPTIYIFGKTFDLFTRFLKQIRFLLTICPKCRF